jgi:hypothetical protein
VIFEFDPYGYGQQLCRSGPQPTAGYSHELPALFVTTAKYGFEQVPVSNGAPPNVAVPVAPLNDGASVTTSPVIVDTNEFEAEVWV